MPQKSIIYRHPFFYRFGLKIFNKAKTNQRNQLIARLVKKGESVLEPGCGLGSLGELLSKKTQYSGFDVNKNFISYCQKKGLKVYLGNALDKQKDQKSDVVVVNNILHHLKKTDRQKFINYCFSSAKRLLIFCDCFKEKDGQIWKSLYPLLKFGFELLEKDGINEPKYNEFYSEQQLKDEIANGFGVIPQNIKRKVQKLGIELVAVFYKT